MSMQLPTLREHAREDWNRQRSRLIEMEFEGRPVWLLNVRDSVFFRIFDLNSHVTGTILKDEYVDFYEPLDDLSNKLRAHFADSWHKGFAGRLVNLPDPLNEQSIILCAVNRTKFCMADDNTFQTWTTHSQPLPVSEKALWELPEADLVALLSRDWSDENSLPRRALEWHQLAHEEKQWAQLSWTRGSREELENLTRWMAHSDAELWQERPLWGINYEFWPSGIAEIKTVRGRTILRPPSPRLTRLGALFLQANQAILQRPPLMPPVTPDLSYSPDHYAFIHIRFTTPSPDEVDEAHLKLRAWLKNRMHDYEIDELVPTP